MDICFVESQSMTVQGSWEKVVKNYGRQWHIKPFGGGCGNWLLTKPSDVLVDGVSYRSSILDYYEATRLTHKLFERFVADVEAGRFPL